MVGFAAVALAVGCHPEPKEATRTEGRFGTVRIVTAGHPSSTIFVFSDAAGWTPALARAARRLAGEGAMVVGVDLGEYLENLRRSSDGCHYVVAEIEDLSHRLEREVGVDPYRSPLLVGVGAGATLAYAALAQAPAATLAGAVGVDPAPALATHVPLCPGAAATKDPYGRFRYAADARLPAPWRTTTTATDDVAAALVGLVRPMLLVPPSADAITRALPGLPLVVLPAPTHGPLTAIIYSGDGGWRDLDKTIGETLAARGIPVIGVDSLRYFWHAKSPERVAADLAAIMSAATAAWGDDAAFLLVGYSFGAGVLPFAVNRLSPAGRERIVEVSLLGLEPRAAFEIEVGGILGRPPSDQALLVAPEVERLDPAMLQCFYGEEEATSLCRDPMLARADVIRTAGGHHFDGNYVALAERILDGAQQRLRRRANPGASRPTPLLSGG